MARPFRRLLAWSKRKLQSRSKRQPRPREITLAHVPSPKVKAHELPPPYPTTSPEPIAGTEPLEPLVSQDYSRVQNPGDVCMPAPPPPKRTLRTAANAAAHCATLGMLHALAGGRPEVVAVRAVKAMAVAMSTSQSYAAFVAAAAAAESVASIYAEQPTGCGSWPPEMASHRVRDAYNDALDTVMGPDENFWPLAFDDDFGLAQATPRPRIPFTTDSTAFCESSPERLNAVRDLTLNLIMWQQRT